MFSAVLEFSHRPLLFLYWQLIYGNCTEYMEPTDTWLGHLRLMEKRRVVEQIGEFYRCAFRALPIARARGSYLRNVGHAYRLRSRFPGLSSDEGLRSRFLDRSADKGCPPWRFADSGRSLLLSTNLLVM
jgi:hypothetical protein